MENPNTSHPSTMADEIKLIPILKLLDNGQPSPKTIFLSKKILDNGRSTPKTIILAQKSFNSTNELVVGRDPTCDIILDHQSVSRFHAHIRSNPALRSVHILDLQSVNGTWVRRKKLEPLVEVRISEGDLVAFGFSRLVYVLHWVQAYDKGGQFGLEMIIDEKKETHQDYKPEIGWDDVVMCLDMLVLGKSKTHDLPVRNLNAPTAGSFHVIDNPKDQFSDISLSNVSTENLNSSEIRFDLTRTLYNRLRDDPMNDVEFHGYETKRNAQGSCKKHEKDLQDKARSDESDLLYEIVSGGRKDVINGGVERLLGVNTNKSGSACGSRPRSPLQIAVTHINLPSAESRSGQEAMVGVTLASSLTVDSFLVTLMNALLKNDKGVGVLSMSVGWIAVILVIFFTCYVGFHLYGLYHDQDEDLKGERIKSWRRRFFAYVLLSKCLILSESLLHHQSLHWKILVWMVLLIVYLGIEMKAIAGVFRSLIHRH